MFMYKIEITMADKNGCLIVLAESDEKAFDYVEGHVVRHYISRPVMKEIAIVEKKRVEKGSGYFLETAGP